MASYRPKDNNMILPTNTSNMRTHTHTFSVAVVDPFGSLRFISSLLTAGTHCLSSAVCFATTVKQGGLQRDLNNLPFSLRL